MPGEKSRGEIGEIRTQLNALSASGSRPEAATAKKELFKKVINCMTIGIDMSSLFMQVMTAGMSNAEDVVLKKMLYLFICTYAQSNPDLTLLTINLLNKDCKDQDPTIRGLALRSLCSLRVANLIEYIVSPVSLALQDRNPYVRRTAVLGVLKIYNLDAAAVRNAGMLEDLHDMLQKDPDAQVVANCMSVLLETGSGQSLVTRALVISLLNRIKDFSEWAQCQVLEFAAHYRPSGEQEVYDFMNVLDDRLSHSNSAVVMATVKMFLHYTLTMPATHQQVLERIKDPLMTLLSRDHFETAFAVLCHFHLIAQRAPIIFSQIYTTFYCRINEPSYIKFLKLDILAAIADETNAYDIATELTEYVNDIDEKLARKAIRTVGKIALEVQDVPGLVERLLGFLDIGKDFVTAETIVQVKDLARKYPDIAEVCVGSVSNISLEDVEEPQARAAFIWILGEHGQTIQDAPYLLEACAQGFTNEETQVQLAMLSAVMKLFFKRPPECQQLLGATLAAAAAEPSQDVHDRALLYYRLLHYNVQEARRVVAAPVPPIARFAEEQSPEQRDRIFDELNTLAVVYRQPSSAFTNAAPPHKEEEDEGLIGAGAGIAVAAAAAPVTAPAVAVDEGSSLLSHDEQQEAFFADPTANGAAPAVLPAPPPSAPAPAMDFLGLDDLLAGTGLAPTPQPQQPPAPPPLQLRPQPQLSPQVFQQKWGALTNITKFQHSLSPSAMAFIEGNKHQDFCKKVTAANIAVMASGGAPPTYRFYFHSQRADRETRILVESIVDKNTSAIQVTIKAEDSSSPEQFQRLYQHLLGGLQ
ncbi:hypothetical protein ABBQ32_009407 [Trebouxia sp. C0010 RCD-2024]